MDWKATIEKILAERRAEMGERPSPTDFAALREGALSETERENLLERAAVDPEVASELFDVLAFPNVPREEDDSDPERRWQVFRERIRREGSPPGTAKRPLPEPLHAPRRSWLALAASFVLGAISTVAIVEMQGPADRGDGASIQVNLPIVELLPAGDPANRGDQVTRVPAGAHGVVATLAMTAPTREGDVYELRVRHPSGRVAGPVEGLEPGPGDVFVVTLPRSLLADGEVELELTDADGALFASYRLRLELLR